MEARSSDGLCIGENDRHAPNRCTSESRQPSPRPTKVETSSAPMVRQCLRLALWVDERGRPWEAGSPSNAQTSHGKTCPKKRERRMPYPNREGTPQLTIFFIPSKRWKMDARRQAQNNVEIRKAWAIVENECPKIRLQISSTTQSYRGKRRSTKVSPKSAFIR